MSSLSQGRSLTTLSSPGMCMHSHSLSTISLSRSHTQPCTKNKKCTKYLPPPQNNNNNNNNTHTQNKTKTHTHTQNKWSCFPFWAVWIWERERDGERERGVWIWERERERGMNLRVRQRGVDLREREREMWATHSMQQVVCKMCSVGNRTGITPLALAIAGVKSLPRNEVFARIPSGGRGGQDQTLWDRIGMLTLAYSVTEGLFELKTPFLFFSFLGWSTFTYTHTHACTCMYIYIYTHTHLHTYSLRSQACQRSNAECFSLRPCEVQSSLNFVWMLMLKHHMLLGSGAITCFSEQVQYIQRR